MSYPPSSSKIRSLYLRRCNRSRDSLWDRCRFWYVCVASRLSSCLSRLCAERVLLEVLVPPGRSCQRCCSRGDSPAWGVGERRFRRRPTFTDSSCQFLPCFEDVSSTETSFCTASSPPCPVSSASSYETGSARSSSLSQVCSSLSSPCSARPSTRR